MLATATRRSLTWLMDFHNRTVLFRLGDFVFVTYGLLVAAAFSAGLGIAAWYYGALGLDPVRMVNISVLLFLPGVLLGARAFSVLLDGTAILRDPVRTLLKPGYMLHGGVFGGLVAMAGYARFAGVALLPIMDAWALAMPLGEAICRLGCFVYGCCHGAPTDGPVSVCYHSEHSKVVRTRPELRGVPIHPAQVYASAAHTLQFLILLALLPLVEHSGTLAGLYMVSHPIIRVILERFRLDDRGKLGVLTHTNIYSGLQFLAGVAMLSLSGGWATRQVLDWSGDLATVASTPSALALWGVLVIVSAMAFGLHYKKVGSWVD
jgi:prolipoprotein diacylglyceryl transferase